MSTPRIVMFAMLLVTLAAWLVPGENSLAQGNRVKGGDYQLSGPYTHDNLSLCLIHGTDHFKGRKFLMLAEALEQKKFVIYETQSVNELNMENLGDVDVVILSGDILKGGQQDRIAQHDQLVPPKSGKLPLTVFCVERTAGRWMRKMTEEDKTFASSPGQLCTNELRLANRFAGKQGEVWEQVMKTQARLSAQAKVDVKAKESDSSLPLSLEAKEIVAATEKYTAKLSTLLEGKSDVVGYVFAINGKVLSSDVYSSPALFAKVWPRFLRANAIEAFADVQKDRKYTIPATKAFATFLDEMNKSKVTAKDDAKGLHQSQNEASRILRFESFGGKGANPALPPLRVNGVSY